MRMTKRLYEAIDEALNFRLAGVINEGEDAPKPQDYEDATQWLWAKYYNKLYKGTAKQ